VKESMEGNGWKDLIERIDRERNGRKST